MKKYIIMLLLAGGLFAACVNDGTLVSEPTAVMQYQRNPTQARLLALAHAYAEAVNLNLDEGVAHPGLYADYGVALAQLGCPEQANIMFNNEKMFFPHSAPYVDMLKQTFAPAYAADGRTDTSHIDLSTLDTIRVTLTAEELALQEQLANDPEYQKQLKMQQKEERAQQALTKQQEKKARDKAKKEEKKAKEKAKKDAQRAKSKPKRPRNGPRRTPSAPSKSGWTASPPPNAKPNVCATERNGNGKPSWMPNDGSRNASPVVRPANNAARNWPAATRHGLSVTATAKPPTAPPLPTAPR